MGHPPPVVSLPLMGVALTLGNLSIWLGLASAVTCVVLYWAAMLRTMRHRPEGSAAPPGNGKGAAAGTGKKGGKRQATQVETRSPEEQKTERVALWARRFFYVTCGFVVLGALSLLSLVLTQQYNVEYVHKNSNSALPFGYRFASFWSDQEGTFFVWALYNSILGGVFLWKCRQDERWVMPFFTLVNVSLFALLLFMNPFWLGNPEEIRKGLTQAGVDPGMLAFLPSNTWQHVVYYFGWGQYLNPKLLDGRGLNEQLQNFWMVIHPPTLFVGYASMMLPSSFALGALMRRDYDSWVNRAAPWLMFAWTVLGTGIFLGAYWAYETLGWGGYWSWDPVENASFVPWIVGTALIHGLLGQRARGNFKQANLFLGIMLGVVVLLASFLVRSGVLGSTSVHSFAAPQKSVFYTLLGVLVLWTVMSVGIWAWRFKDVDSEIAYERVWERHFGFFLGLISLCAIAIVILFGVFFVPVLLPMIITKKLNIDHTFYNKALLPVVFVLTTLMAFTPLMPWRQRAGEPRPMKTFNKVALGIGALITLFFLGGAVWAWTGHFITRNDPAYLAFVLMLGLALVTNVVCLARAARGGIFSTGAWLAHIGFIVMLAGVMVTTRYKTVHSFQRVAKDTPVTVLGREFIWRGQREAANPTDRERMLIDMRMPDGKVISFDPKLFHSKIANQTMAWPQIRNEWIGGAWGDVYVEPVGVDNTGNVPVDSARKGVPVEVRIQHTSQDPEDVIQLTFESLDTSEMQKAMQAMQSGGGHSEDDGHGHPPGEGHGMPGSFTLYADVTLNINGVEQKIRPALRMAIGPAGMQPDPIPLRIEGLRQGSGYTLLFRETNLEPGNLTANFGFVPDVAVAQGYFQVLHVPGIQVLWFGVYIMIAGAFLSWRRRSKLALQPVGSPRKKPESGLDATARAEAEQELERELGSAE